MIKARLTDTTVLVTFELPAAVVAESASVCGDFNDWSPTDHPLARTKGGAWRADVELPAGRRWRFRYLVDGQRWENDWAADDYLPNAFGGDDSVLDLTAAASLPPADGSHGSGPAAASEPATGISTAQRGRATASKARSTEGTTSAASATSRKPRKSSAAATEPAQSAATTPPRSKAAAAEPAESSAGSKRAQTGGSGNSAKA